MVVPPTLGADEGARLQQMVNALTPELLNSQGAHVAQNNGAACTLLVELHFGGRGCKWDCSYPEGSAGPPAPILEFVRQCIRITDIWLQNGAIGRHEQRGLMPRLGMWYQRLVTALRGE